MALAELEFAVLDNCRIVTWPEKHGAKTALGWSGRRGDDACFKVLRAGCDQRRGSGGSQWISVKPGFGYGAVAWLHVAARCVAVQAWLV